MLDNRLHFQFPSLARAPNGAAGRMDQSRYASYPRDYLCALTYCTASVSFSSFFLLLLPPFFHLLASRESIVAQSACHSLRVFFLLKRLQFSFISRFEDGTYRMSNNIPEKKRNVKRMMSFSRWMQTAATRPAR